MSARLAIRVQPGARTTGVVGWMADGALKLRVSAPPEDGRANQAVVELLASLLGLERSQVTVVRGGSSRSKVIEAEGLDAKMAKSRLEAAVRVAEGRDDD